jgi:DNA-binding NtrC family response regulator
MAGFQPPRSARRMVRFVQIHRAMPSRAPAARSRPVLVVAPSSAERAELFGALEARSDFRVLYAASVDEAVQALRDRSIALLIASSELPAAAVSELLAAKVRLRPALPMLVIRNRQAEEPVGWERSGVGVLRRPLLPEALDRSVDVVLGLGGE